MEELKMPIRRSSWVALIVSCAFCVGTVVNAAPEDFPKPPGLHARVDFWKRVYTEIDTSHGFLHDSKDLGIVYQTVEVPKGLSRRGRENVLKKHREKIKASLRRLAAGKREGLSADDARILALFPAGVSNKTLSTAAGSVRFQLGQSDKFRAGLQRQGRWSGHMAEVFHRRELPPELTALPHVESSFNPAARSHVGASGIWQFTRSTGRLFMQVDHVVDERNDPWLATESAAELLGRNFEATDSWPLAITAYNHGTGGMKRAIRRLGTRDI